MGTDRQLLREKLDEYYEKFGDVFPMAAYKCSYDQIIKIIDKCIKSNKKVILGGLDKGVCY